MYILPEELLGEYGDIICWFSSILSYGN